MDFKTKTALCIARLYNSSACVFWLAQTPTERTQQTERWLLVQEQAGGCVFLQSTLPLSLVKHSQDTFPSQSWQLLLCHQWVPAVGTAGRCSQLEAPLWTSCCSTGLCENCRTQQNNGKPFRAVKCLQVKVCCLLILLQSCSRTWWSVEPWPAAPEARGTAQRRTTVGCCTRTQRMLRGFSRTEHCRFYFKSKVPRVLHRLVLMW